jgi:DNA-binding transcriptional regulator YiaG
MHTPDTLEVAHASTPPVPMTAEQFTQALVRLHMTQADYARLIEVSQKTIWTWASGRTSVPKLASEHLGVLLALHDLHQRFVGR